MKTLRLPAAALALALAAPLSAQGPRPEPDLTIDAAARTAVIDNVLRELNQAYVFPEKAREMETAIRQRQRRREYDALTGARAFADSLTAHLQAVSRDKHLRVRFSPEPIPVPDSTRRATPEERERQRENGRITNYGFEKVERLQGNVAYLELRGFQDTEAGSETAVAAMNFVSNADALIIDLRRNGGGSPAMVQLVSSYLFDEPTHLNSLYFRPADSTDQFWTLPHVPGRRLGGSKPIFVLTSDRTFSAAEEFTYNLQTRGRATVVGDTTGGGAHPGGMRRLHQHFAAFIPSGRAINPVTGTNWEGTGVRPDVAVPTDQALETAYVAALERILAGTTDPQRRRQLEDVLAEQRRKLEELRARPRTGG